MPSRLRPTAPVAPDAILVGDPGRALLLAQELLEQPKMSNHARGLWGYSGETQAGRELTIQATGMGGPSAAIVLADLAKLGVRRAVRVGTCTALAPELEAGELLVVARGARRRRQRRRLRGRARRRRCCPIPSCFERLRRGLGDEAQAGRSQASTRTRPTRLGRRGRGAADMQTVAVLAAGRELGVAAAAVLIVAEAEPAAQLWTTRRWSRPRNGPAGAAAAALST